MADYLNNLFHHRGPPSALDQVLGSSGQSLLQNLFPARSFEDGKGTALFPIKDGSPRPLQRLGDAQLQTTIGLLRRFDARQNSAVEGGSPFCSFLARPYMRGASQLEVYGPMTGHMLDVVMKALSGLFLSTYGGMKTHQDVERAFKTTYTR